MWSRRTTCARRCRIRQMRAHLDSMGPVNMMALEESKDDGPHQFLETSAGPAGVDRKQRRARSGRSIPYAREIPRSVRAHQRELPIDVPQALRAARVHAPYRRRNTAESGIDVVASHPVNGYRTCCALWWREGAHGLGRCWWASSSISQSVLYSGRSGRFRSMRQYRTIHGVGAGDELANPIVLIPTAKRP